MASKRAEDRGTTGSAAQRPGARALLPALGASLFTVGLAFVASRHEMWRDEIQAWLVARDCANLLQVLLNTPYEGHAKLWPLLLWPLAHISGDPAWMQALHVVIAGAAAFLVLRFAPFPAPVRVLTILGYYFAYEWAVIARNYAISVLLVFAFCALYPRRWQRLPAAACALFLLCQTHVYAIILAIAFTASLVMERIVSRAARAARPRGVWPWFGLAALGIAAGTLQTVPPPDSGFARGWHFAWSAQRQRVAAGAVVQAFLPVPQARLHFWNTNRFLAGMAEEEPAPRAAPGARDGAWRVDAWRRTAAAGTLLLAACLVLAPRPWALVPFGLSSAGLLAFFYLKYAGGCRHHGFIFLAFLAAAWMSWSHGGRAGTGRAGEGLRMLWDRHRALGLVPILLVHVWGASVAIRVDLERPFSQAQAAGRWIARQFAGRADVFLAGDGSQMAAGVLGHARMPAMFYPDRDAFGSFIVWDERRNAYRRKRDLLPRVRAEMESSGRDALLVLNWRPSARGMPAGMRELEWFAPAVVRTECFCICLWERQPPAQGAAGPRK